MSSEHSIEYHKTWAVFFTIVVVGLVVMALYGMAIGHDTYLATGWTMRTNRSLRASLRIDRLLTVD
jgi:quinol-cytochrome oxidoreductase complex cytochrome b subunit